MCPVPRQSVTEGRTVRHRPAKQHTSRSSFSTYLFHYRTAYFVPSCWSVLGLSFLFCRLLAAERYEILWFGTTGGSFIGQGSLDGLVLDSFHEDIYLHRRFLSLSFSSKPSIWRDRNRRLAPGSRSCILPGDLRQLRQILRHCTSGNRTAMSPDWVMYRTHGNEGYCNYT